MLIVYKRVERAIKYYVEKLEPELREEAEKLKGLESVADAHQKDSASRSSRKRSKKKKDSMTR